MRGKKNAATKTSTRLRETANKWLSSHTLTHTLTHTHVVHADGLMKEETIVRERREGGRPMKESRVACNKQCATATRTIACGEETKRVVWHCRHCRHPHTVSAQWATTLNYMYYMYMYSMYT